MTVNRVLFIAALMGPLAGGTVGHGESATTVRRSDQAPVLTAMAVASEEIPDDVAYSMLFRLLADTPSRPDELQTRAYMRFMGLGRVCQTCGSRSKARTEVSGDDRELELFASFLKEVHASLERVDVEARGLMGERAAFGSSDVAPLTALRLAELKRQRTQHVRDAREAITGRIGSDAASRIHTFVATRMKPRMHVLKFSE